MKFESYRMDATILSHRYPRMTRLYKEMGRCGNPRWYVATLIPISLVRLYHWDGCREGSILLRSWEIKSCVSGRWMSFLINHKSVKVQYRWMLVLKKTHQLHGVTSGVLVSIIAAHPKRIFCEDRWWFRQSWVAYIHDQSLSYCPL